MPTEVVKSVGIFLFGSVMNIFFRSNRAFISRILLITFGANFGLSLLAADTSTSGGQASSVVDSRQTVYSRISDMHLPSVRAEDVKEQAEMKKSQEENDKAYNEMLTQAKFKEIKIPAVGDIEKLRLIYNLFHGRSLQLDDVIGTNRSVLNDNVFTDLQIYCGSMADLKHHVFGAIDNTVTSFGKVELQKFLYQRPDSVEQLKYEIKNRQDIVKYLVENPFLCDKIEQQLKIVKQCETDLLWFWKALEFSIQKYTEQYYFRGILSGLNESTGPLEFNSLMMTVVTPAEIALVDALMVGLSAYMLYLASREENHWAIGGAVAYSGLCLFSAYMMTSMIAGLVQTFNGVTNDIHGKLASTARITEASTDLTKILAADSKMPLLWGNFKKLQTSAVQAQDGRDLQDLLTKFKADTFKGEPSYFSNKGRVLACCKKMLRLKDNFINSIKSIGELDAYLSIAKLYLKHVNNSNAKFCFPEIIESDRPYVNINKLWHPFLNPEKVVTNDIELGKDTSQPDMSQNVILTGPNAAGKSTFLKAFTVSLILAQSFGIAPASVMKFTPFIKINTYLNIADEEGRESLFQAEMRRAQELLSSIKGLKKGEFSFVIMDEIFTGTNPKEGTAGAYAVAKSVSKYLQSICIVATHFKKLTDLEADTNGRFKNYKVYVNRFDTGDIHYPYKVVPGISDQAIALLLLEKQGFDREILDEASAVFDKL